MKNTYSVGQVNRYIKNMFTQDYLLQKISENPNPLENNSTLG